MFMLDPPSFLVKRQSRERDNGEIRSPASFFLEDSDAWPTGKRSSELEGKEGARAQPPHPAYDGRFVRAYLYSREMSYRLLVVRVTTVTSSR